MAPRLFACFGKSSAGRSSRSDAGAANHAAVAAEVPPGEGPVLVELFSSQGCATSPEAEILISRLGRGDFSDRLAGTPLVVLAFHVDYWDYTGWKDPFGSSQWTVRQKAYVEALKLDTIFTPQVVVQGMAQCVGNEEDALIKTITSAPGYPAPGFQATFQRPTSGTLQVTLTGPLRMKVDHDGVDVMVALYESGLVTDCQRGENRGRVLSNDFVVRKLEKLCTVRDISAKKVVSGTVHFTLWDGFNSAKCGVALFVQDSSHQIFGSQNFQLPNEI